MAMQGFKLTDFNIQIPTSGLGQGGKVSLNAIVSSLLSLLSLQSISLSRCGCRTETSAKIPVAKETDLKLWKRESPKKNTGKRSGDVCISTSLTLKKVEI